MNDEAFFQKYMEQCELLGSNAAKKGNAPVGCIILQNGKIIAAAEETATSKEDVTCHAEIEAIRMARKSIGKNMEDCTMITTHEPCVMCAYAIRFHGIKKVVFKNKVKHLDSVSSQMDILTTNAVSDNWSAPPTVVWLK